MSHNLKILKTCHSLGSSNSVWEKNFWFPNTQEWHQFGLLRQTVLNYF